MREIKFRAWNGVLHEYRTIDMNSGKQNLGMGFEATEGIGSNTTTIYHSVGDVIEQYTGLKDKNGVDIYEGDIVELYSETHDIFGFEITKKQTGRIYFVDGAFFISGGNGDDPIYAYEGELEIIGNIHENADLLEEQS
ncbi:YopX family protein [Leuconostoc mesenteroides]|uniref:YopX family protein n=1 Tax=Leuconostoc mesenteroides TaxID=1245 RepID=UPI00235FA56C|nr:YopX family protein [Leuconostoc mesenteroides]